MSHHWQTKAADIPVFKQKQLNTSDPCLDEHMLETATASL